MPLVTRLCYVGVLTLNITVAPVAAFGSSVSSYWSARCVDLGWPLTHRDPSASVSQVLGGAVREDVVTW